MSVCPYCGDVDDGAIPPGVDVVQCTKCDGWWALTNGEYDRGLTEKLGMLAVALEAKDN